MGVYGQAELTLSVCRRRRPRLGSAPLVHLLDKVVNAIKRHWSGSSRTDTNKGRNEDASSGRKASRSMDTENSSSSVTDRASKVNSAAIVDVIRLAPLFFIRLSGRTRFRLSQSLNHLHTAGNRFADHNE